MASRRRARWIVYSLLAALAVLALGMYLYTRSGHFDRWARQRLIETLERELGRGVTVERVEVRYLPPGAVVIGLRSEAPEIAAERIEVELSIRALLRGRLFVKELEVVRPALRWDVDTERLLAKRVRPDPAEQPPRLTLRRLRVVSGTLLVGSSRRDVEADIEGFSALVSNLTGTAGFEGSWSGGVRFTRGRFRFGDLQLAGAQGSVTFEADQGVVQVKTLHVKADGVVVHGNGAVSAADPLRASADLRASVVPASPSITRPLPQLGAERVELTLQIAVDEAGTRISGTFDADQPSVDPDRDEGSYGPLAVWRGTRASGRLESKEGRLTLEGTMEGIAGGSAVASYEGDASHPRRHRVTLDARSLDLATILSQLPLPGDPGAAPSGVVTGKIEHAWATGGLAEGEGRARVVIDERPGALPLSGEANLSWRGPQATIASSSFRVPGSSASVSGIIGLPAGGQGSGAGRTDLKIDMSADDATPLARFLETRFASTFRRDDGGRRLPLVPTDVEGSFHALIGVERDAAGPRVAASFSSFATRVSLPSGIGQDGGAATAARVPLALDLLEAGVTWSPRQLELAIDRASGEDFDLSGDIAIATPPTGPVPRRVTVEAEAISAEMAAALAGLTDIAAGISGTVRLSADLTAQDASAGGAAGAPGLRGPISLSSPRLIVRDLVLDDASARGTLEGDRIVLEEASLSALGGTARGNGVWSLRPQDPQQAGAIDLSIAGLDLAALQAQWGGPAMTGILAAQGRLTGGPVPTMTATIQSQGLTLGGVDLGEVSGTLAGTADRLAFDLSDAAGALRADGNLLHLADPQTAAIEARVTARPFSLERIRPLIPENVVAGLRGDADADVTVSGPLRSLKDLTVRARVDRLSLAAGEYTLHNDGPLSLTMMDGFLTLATGRLVGDRTDLTVGGSMNLGGAHEATILLEGKLDVGLIELIDPEVRAAGPGTIDIRIVEGDHGTRYSGGMTITNASLRHPALPQPLERINAVARFDDEGILRIEPISFDTGGGHATGTGWVRFERASVPEARLDLRAAGVRSEILTGLRAFFDADISILKDGESVRVTGRVDIHRAIYDRPFGLEPSSLLARNREFGPARAWSGKAPEILLDVRLLAERDLWIRNDDALIEASANLLLTGTVDEPELYGRILTLDGTYRFREVTYRIEGGSLEFADIGRIDPALDIKASTRVQQYDVVLSITGELSRPVFELTSEPPLAQSDIVWLLLTGKTLTESGSETNRAAAEGQVAAYLAAPVAGAVTAPLVKLPGVSSVSIDPTLLNGADDPTARVTVTTRVRKDVLFTYSSALGDSGKEVYQIEYNPGRIVDLLGTRDEDGSVGGDIRIRRRWRGWGWAPDAREEAAGKDEGIAIQRFRVGAIRILSDRVVDSESSLRRKLPFDVGDPLVRGDLLEGREILRQHLVDQGYPAAEVDVVESDPAGDPPTLNITYTIKTGPLHELEVNSDTARRPIRKAVKKAWEEPLLVEDITEEARLAAEKTLRERGRYTAKVQASQESPEPDRRVVALAAEPGPKVRVSRVIIEGNALMPEERIRRQMLTKPGGFLTMFGRGLLKENVLGDDVGAIRALYLANGYLEVDIPAPAIRLSPDSTEAEVVVRINEGPQYRVGSVALEGDVPGVDGGALLKALDLSPGQNISQQVLTGATDRLRAALDVQGYPQARISSRIEGPQERTRVVFTVSHGERVRIAGVTFSGNARTNDRTIHREITLDTGDYLTRASTLETQRNLYRLGVFRSVDVRTTPAPGQPGFVNVHLDLTEGPPILTAWGFGYDTEDGPRVSFELADNNLFGSRRSAGIFLKASAVDRRAQLTIRDPNLFGERIETLLSGFVEREENDSFTAHRIGAVGQLSRKVSDHATLFGRYRLEDVDLSDLEVTEEEAGEQTVRLGHAGTGIAHDSRDSIIFPTRGGLSSFDVRTYGPLWGSEEQFLKVFGSATAFVKLGTSVVWASALRSGLITSRDIPISERFFAGGDTTLRGFDYNEAGPKDPVTGEPVGGQFILLFNQELRFPIYKAITGVTFYDAGNVFAELSDYDSSDIRHVFGVGLRVSTPVGPFRVEYGRKLDREPEESVGEFFFSIGQAF